jgi:hypothetical protein
MTSTILPAASTIVVRSDDAILGNDGLLRVS